MSEGHERTCKEARRLLGKRHSALRTTLVYMLRAIPGCVVRSEQRRHDTDYDDDAGVARGTQGADSDDETARMDSHHRLPASAPEVSAIQPDICFGFPNDKALRLEYYVDLAVVEPLAPSYAGRDPVQLIESAKDAKYHHWVMGDEAHRRFFAFGVSSVGQLGVSASALVDLARSKCSADHAFFGVSFWYARMAAVLAKFAHQMENKWARAVTNTHPPMACASFGKEQRMPG